MLQDSNTNNKRAKNRWLNAQSHLLQTQHPIERRKRKKSTTGCFEGMKGSP